MTTTQLLTNQTTDTYQWIRKLIDPISDNLWTKTPDILDSNISWQVGHLVISIYYHTVLMIKGHQSEILEKVPLKTYSENYNINAASKNATDLLTPTELKKHLDIIENKSLKIIESLSANELEQELILGKVVHPVAKTKLEAIDWNIKHTMWHCGQIASLKRVLGDPYKFELKKNLKPNYNCN